MTKDRSPQDLRRRGFFGAILAGATVAEAMAEAKNVDPITARPGSSSEDLRRVPVDADSVFALTLPVEGVNEAMVDRVQVGWRSCFPEGKAPKLIILERGAKLERAK